MIPNDPSCWMDDTWRLPREVKDLKAAGFLKVVHERAQFHLSLEHTTRVAKVLAGPHGGKLVGFLPLFTQFHECPEDVISDETLTKTFNGGKMKVLVPPGFIRDWFRTENGLLFSNVSGGPLPAVLNQKLMKTEKETDIIPFLEHIFGSSLSLLVLKRVPEFIQKVLAVQRGYGPITVEVIFKLFLKKFHFLA